MNIIERTIAAAILKYEDDRVTGPATLRITRLPAADKGGKWEICGICNGIEPAIFNGIKTLLDSGQREAAWQACLQYVLDNTATVRIWIGSDTHPATELFLRDHYFNSGNKNTGKILQHALNNNGHTLTVDGLVGSKTKQTLQTTLAQGNERDLLSHLRDSRRAFYTSCTQYPTFGKGWLRRCDDVYDLAQTLL